MKISKWLKSLWAKFISLVKWVWKQLKDWRNLIIFGIVCAVVGCEVWVPALIGIITGNAWWYGIAGVCWAFWLAPFTPFLPLCIGITIGVRKILDKLFFGKKGKKQNKKTKKQKNKIIKIGDKKYE